LSCNKKSEREEDLQDKKSEREDLQRQNPKERTHDPPKTKKNLNWMSII
jgi:hypothetical protein